MGAEKELFHTTLASIGDDVITTEALAQITYLNSVAERLTGWRDLSARGRPLTEVFCTVEETCRGPLDDLARQCLSSNEEAALTARRQLIARDLRQRNIDMSVASIRSSYGASIGVVLVLRDVTEERKLAQELSYRRCLILG